MSWLRFISTVMQGLAGLVSFLRERELLKAGEAKAVTEALELSNDRIRKAMAARDAAANVPLDADDPYRRD